MYVDSSAFFRVKRGESDWFRIHSVVYHVSLALQCIYGWSDEDGADGKEGSELPGGWERVETDWPLVCG